MRGFRRENPYILIAACPLGILMHVAPSPSSASQFVLPTLAIPTKHPACVTRTYRTRTKPVESSNILYHVVLRTRACRVRASSAESMPRRFVSVAQCFLARSSFVSSLWLLKESYDRLRSGVIPCDVRAMHICWHASFSAIRNVWPPAFVPFLGRRKSA